MSLSSTAPDDSILERECRYRSARHRGGLLDFSRRGASYLVGSLNSGGQLDDTAQSHRTSVAVLTVDPA